MKLSEKVKEFRKKYFESIFIISHSHRTITSYQTGLNKFHRFLEEHYSIDEILLVSKLKNKELDIFEVLRDFVIYLDKIENRPNAIRAYLSSTKGFLRYMGIKIDSDECKQFVKIPRQIKTREIPLTKEMILRLLHNANPKLQIAILVAISTGMRIGELVELRIQDIDFSSNPTKVYIRSETTKTRQSRETFLTEETTLALKDYLKRYFGWKENTNNEQLYDKHIFGPVIKPKKSGKFSAVSAQYILQMALYKFIKTIPELSVNNENGRKAIHFHAFRKFFRTTVGNVCGRDYAEALMGHGFYMDTYYQLPEEKQRQMYVDAEPYLTISDFAKVEKDIKTLSVEFLELKKEHEELKQYMKLNSIPGPEHFLKN